MPLYADKDTMGMVTQFDMGDVETIGLVKFDLLGLRTLTIVDWAVNSIRLLDKTVKFADINQIGLDDSRTYQMIQEGETTSIFQLESRGMRELILRLKPDKFEDLIALVALFRPGPLDSGMVDDFIAVKQGRRAKVSSSKIGVDTQAYLWSHLISRTSDGNRTLACRLYLGFCGYITKGYGEKRNLRKWPHKGILLSQARFLQRSLKK